MLNILRSDIYKLFKTKSFFVIIIISILVSVTAVLLVNQATKMPLPTSTESSQVASQNSEVKNDSSNATADVYSAITSLLGDLTVVKYANKIFNDGTIFFMIAIFAGIFVGSDFSSGAMKNIASKGISRNKIYLSKLLTGFLGTFIIMMITLLSVIICTLFIFEFGDFNSEILFDSIVNISKQVSLYFGITSVFIAIAYIFKNNVVSIVSSVCLLLVLPSILNVIDTKLPISSYYIPNVLTSASNAVVNPYLLSLIYIVISAIIGCILFKKQDIK